LETVGGAIKWNEEWEAPKENREEEQRRWRREVRGRRRKSWRRQER